jgi:hypothetical protein
MNVKQPQGHHADERTTRRELLKSAARYGLLAGLVGGVGGLAARNGCGQSACAGCRLLTRCDLTAAQRARAANAEMQQPAPGGWS